ncbi:MAG TPA: YcxB family protein [Gemmatimonadaceae bacterium]|nr:YcxB family protein [Gemmatimonadaceae bacterium]
MRIEYTLTNDDWNAFADYCVDHAPSFIKARKQTQVLTVLTGALLGSAIGGWYGVWWPSAVGVLIGIGGAIFQIPRDMKKGTRKFVLRQTAIAREGRHVADAQADGLYTENDIANAKVAWRMVERIDETPTHVFVLLAEATGYVIPRGPLPTSDLVQFVDVARGHMRSAQQRP